ncbi:MAG: hypothetical protein LBP55_01300 [Candidatus Adiutrix sp.]|jgi:hypothetical protein|nr:hypothetical protein [Candidatus Adiutrix sp.]
MPVLLIIGLVSLLIGLILLGVWFGSFLVLVKALLPLAFLAGGAVASYLGWTERRDRRRPSMDFSSPGEATRYQAEARAYQAEINEIKIEIKDKTE